MSLALTREVRGKSTIELDDPFARDCVILKIQQKIIPETWGHMIYLSLDLLQLANWK